MLTLILSLLMFIDLGCCDRNVWRGIRPLETTRSEVEKIVGKPVGSSTKQAAKYVIDDGEISVTYSDAAGCDKESNSWWNVPELTVLQVTFYPKEKKPFADLSLNKTEFEKIPDNEILHLIEFVNTKAGISLLLDTDTGMVTTYRYFPNQEQNKSFRCKKREKI